MTTAHVTGGLTGFGILPPNIWESALTDNEFTYGGETYSVKGVAREWVSGDLLLEVKDVPESCCPDDLRIAGAQWTLHAGDRSFAIKDAESQVLQGVSVGIYRWRNAPNWSAGQEVDLKIVTTEEDLPFPELSVQGGEVRESGNGTTPTIPFTVSAVPAPAFPVGVHYETEDVTATGGDECSDSPPPDYISTDGRLTFGPDEISNEVEVTVCDDSVEDPGETFRLVLRSTQLHEPISALGKIGPNGKDYKDEDGEDEETASATGTILNTESTTEVSIVAAAAYAEEGTDAAFTLRRTGDAEEALTVPMSVVEGGAVLGTPVPASVTFAAGSRQAALRVPTDDDGAIEATAR